MSKNYVVWLEDAQSRDPLVTGGKFANLSKLYALGIRVPPAFAVSTDAYRGLIESMEEKIEKALLPVDFSNVSSVEAASTSIRNVIRNSELPTDVEEGIKTAYYGLGSRVGAEGALPVAVRSSATAEDLSEASLAGQHESYLWVKGGDGVVMRVVDCWSSMFTPRAIVYRHTMGIDHSRAYMGAIVQKMVNPISSGVMFTLNPTNGDPSKIVVESSWGLGQAIVSGVVTPDLFLVDKVTFEILVKRSNRKLLEHVVVEDKVEEKAVPEERQGVLSLSDSEVLELARLGKALEKEHGAAQDIEWTLDSSLAFPDNVFILQTRPETVWSRRKRAVLGVTGSALDIVVDNLTQRRKTGQ